MRTTITIEGPGFAALSAALRCLAQDTEHARIYPQVRLGLTSREQLFATYGGPTTATIRIEEAR